MIAIMAMAMLVSVIMRVVGLLLHAASVPNTPRAKRAQISENRSVPDAIHIDAPTDPRVSAYRDIREKELAAREGLFVGETLVVLEAMLAFPAAIESVLASPRMIGRTAELLAARGCTAPLYTASDETLEALTGIDLHRGVLAVGRRAPFEPVSVDAFAPAAAPRTVLVCEDITNIDNIGQFFRIAAAFAVDAVLLSPTCHDPLYRKSLRVSTGNALRMPTVRASEWPRDLERFCRRFDLTLVATAIQSSVPHRSISPPPERVAIVVGHESLGVSQQVRALAQHVVRIPMARGVDSLNVAVSAAVALDHFSRGDRE
jgi:tRNA G18 (ribose-2'-O)-methylase SpoU